MPGDPFAKRQVDPVGVVDEEAQGLRPGALQADQVELRVELAKLVLDGTITHDDAVVTEQVSVYLYLADLYPEARLAPPMGDPLRGPYLRWMVFYGSCFEPAVVDRVQNREPIPQARSPYGDFDSVMKTLVSQLKQGPWLFGEQFTAADVLWGSALNWTTQFGLIPEVPEIKAYIARFIERPAYKRALAKDAELAAAQAAPA